MQHSQSLSVLTAAEGVAQSQIITERRKILWQNRTYQFPMEETVLLVSSEVFVDSQRTQTCWSSIHSFGRIQTSRVSIPFHTHYLCLCILFCVAVVSFLFCQMWAHDTIQSRHDDSVDCLSQLKNRLLSPISYHSCNGVVGIPQRSGVAWAI